MSEFFFIFKVLAFAFAVFSISEILLSQLLSLNDVTFDLELKVDFKLE